MNECRIAAPRKEFSGVVMGVRARIKSAGLDLFGFETVVDDCVDIAPGFRLITISGPRLSEQKWQPGHKMQIRTPDDHLRTYTPLWWDSDNARTQFLGAGLGSGPGTDYLAGLRSGDQLNVFNVGRSLDLALPSAPIIVGDETVLGLAAAWNIAHPDEPAAVMLEARDIEVLRAAAAAMRIDVAEIVEYGDRLAGIVREAATASPEAPLVISGRAQSIKRVRAALKVAGLHRRDQRVRAYWDENRSGLD
jgi:NADPH-dependent ferric siderophore reductase